MAIDSSNPEDLAAGCLLAIRITFDDEFKGQVITSDHPSNILVLQEGSKAGPRRNINLCEGQLWKISTFLG